MTEKVKVEKVRAEKAKSVDQMEKKYWLKCAFSEAADWLPNCLFQKLKKFITNVIFAMFVYFLLILNSGYSIWIFGFRKKQEAAFLPEELPILTSSKVSSWLIAAKSNLMTRLDWAIFGEVDSCSVLLFVEELLLVSSSEVPIPSSGKAPSSPASKDSFLYYFPLMIACLIFYPPLS